MLTFNDIISVLSRTCRVVVDLSLHLVLFTQYIRNRAGIKVEKQPSKLRRQK